MARHDDPDDTEGRRLYRAHADRLAKAQESIGRRNLKRLLDKEKTDDDTPKNKTP